MSRVGEPSTASEAPFDESIDAKYRVLLELGRGGAANVFLAIARGEQGFNKLVVVKVPNAVVARDPELLEMLIVEARLAARLNHGNIVQTNEIAQSGSRPMIVMEYLEGQPLSKIIERAGAALSLPMHLRILSEALSGLHHAHECTDFDGTKLEVVHRDMTPHNVFVTYDGQVKILDFGIAKVQRFGQETETGIVKGKLRYMPAEQIAGEAIDRRADLFAVGVMLWEAAARRPIFQGEAERDVLNAVLNDEIPSPRELEPDTPPELERICMKALSANPEDRHPDALALQADIERLIEQLGGRSISGRDLGALVAGQFAAEREAVRTTIEARLADILKAPSGRREASHAAVGASPDPSPRAKRARARAAYVAAAALIGVLGAVAWGIWAGRRPPPGPEAQTTPAEPPAPTGQPVPGLPSAAGVASQSSASTSPANPPAAESIRVRIEARPPAATLYLDGAPLPSNPYSGELPKDGQLHEVEAKAVGYSPAARSVTFDGEIDVTLSLVPRGAPIKPPPNEKPSCTPPYTIDANGLKRYIPGCF